MGNDNSERNPKSEPKKFSRLFTFNSTRAGFNITNAGSKSKMQHHNSRMQLHKCRMQHNKLRIKHSIQVKDVTEQLQHASSQFKGTSQVQGNSTSEG